MNLPLKKSLSVISVSIMLSVSTQSLALQQTAIYSSVDRHHPVWAANGMVATQEAYATEVGVQILEKGGNAVDAAVAVGFTLAVTLPRAGNLGGGGFMLYFDNDDDKGVAIDYREKAPANATRDQFLDANGDADSNLSQFHGLSVGVPGTVAGLLKAHEEHGSLPLEDLITPAIELAENGIVVSPDLADSLADLKERIGKWPSSEKIFYKADGSNYEPGDILVQKDLANTLRLILEKGAAGFYEGPVAKSIVKAVKEADGNMEMSDFANYQAVNRQPVAGDYRGYKVISMPPPSSGGIHIIQILNMLEHYPIAEMGVNNADTMHVMAEAMKLAYADRSEYLGDADFVDVPVEGLTSKEYAKSLVEGIDLDHARPASEIKPNNPIPYESNQTTHYSIVDKEGNAVANTYTLNFSYGTGLVAEGTGVLLNNEMDDFSAKPGVPNGYGLIGGDANAVEANKRPLSSMSPTIVLKDNDPYLVTGSPGGSRIITTTLQMILNVVDHDMNVAQATHAPRMHHQWLPDEIRIEEGFSKDTIGLLEAKGHTVIEKDAMGSTQSIMIEEGGLYGSSDPRQQNALTKGY
ncbi:gamma-glutamyltransferase [Suttonella sp. R2A3]|uniref:gamma-glutamyltransferase n=1 Tax=Suttonella sp. R2A3 TaxID=2908648 RepID=UPI001F48B455|nr:gamma-glutamyltransferase [Suttonella sp. R2A3]UJF24878.1 gamma-glutamyltransferase [Suttonella sp. R2A3]